MKPIRSFVRAFALLSAGVFALVAAACGGSGGTAVAAGPAAPVTNGATASLANSPALTYPATAVAPRPDPRVGLKPGYMDAGTASWNLKTLAHVPPSTGFTGMGTTGSDLAFTGDLAIQGTYRGFQIWNVANPATPRLITGFVCPTSQGDPSVYGNLLFISGESTASRNDCGATAIPRTDSVSMDRFLGVRILDISNPAAPRIVANVQTCRGSHTHTVLKDPRDNDNLYIYVSGYSNVRSPTELPGCVNAPATDPNSASFRIEVIQVPLSHPQDAKVINSPHLLADLVDPQDHANPPRAAGAGGGGGAAAGGAAGGAAAGRPAGAAGAGGAPAAGAAAGAGGAGAAAGGAAAGRPAGAGGGGGGGGAPAGPRMVAGCHDITTYPAVGLAGGACSGYGILFDIRDAKNPKRLVAVADSNMSFWHSATFSNDGDKVLFSDEWGGGGQPYCQASHPLIWGGNAIFTIENGGLKFHSYIKMPAAQTDTETCTAHNGSLIPIPGREVMVQSYYQGGISIYDWTNADKPMEIGFYDEGPVPPRDPNAPAGTPAPSGGFWSSYWYNGAIYGSDEGRGFYSWELQPGPYITQHEIDAAKSVKMAQFNAQHQERFVWPNTFALAGSFVDQMKRNNGLPAARLTAIQTALDTAERATGGARTTALNALATSIQADMAAAADKGRTARLLAAVQGLASGR